MCLFVGRYMPCVWQKPRPWRVISSLVGAEVAFVIFDNRCDIPFENSVGVPASIIGQLLTNVQMGIALVDIVCMYVRAVGIIK